MIEDYRSEFEKDTYRFPGLPLPQTILEEYVYKEKPYYIVRDQNFGEEGRVAVVDEDGNLIIPLLGYGSYRTYAIGAKIERNKGGA